MKRFMPLFALGSLLSMQATASAAEILDMNGSPYTNALVSGPIERGDTRKLQAFLEDKWSRGKEGGDFGAGGPNAHVYFDSSGGSLEEALRLGAFLRENLVASVVAEDQVCSGPCAWAFIGGSSGFTTGGHEPNRKLEGGKLHFTGFDNKRGGIDIAELTSYAVRMGMSWATLTKILSLTDDATLDVTSIAKISAQDDSKAADPQPLDRQSVPLCNQATDWQRPLAIDDQQAKRRQWPIAKVQGLSPHQAQSAIFSAVLQYHKAEKGTLIALIQQATKGDQQHLEELFEDISDLGWLFDLHGQSPAIVYQVTGWPKDGKFDVLACLVVFGRAWYAQPEVIVLRPTGNLVIKPQSDRDLRSYYRKRSLY